MTKLCPSCQEEKLFTEFSKSKDRKDGHCVYCKQCSRRRGKAYKQTAAGKSKRANWVSQNKDKVKASATKYWKKHYLVIRQLLDDAKSVPCSDCGQSYPPWVMDFDHVRGEKTKDVSRMLVGYSVERVKTEVSKCDVVCANCHRERTHERDTYSSWRASA